MNLEETHQELMFTIETYCAILSKYDFNQLTTITKAADWSMAQVFTHLFEQTIDFNFILIDQCLSTNEFYDQQKTVEGEAFFKRGGFPDERIKAPFDDIPAVPTSLDTLIQSLEKIKIQLSQYKVAIQSSSIQGKAIHPGLGYLNAQEWYAFILMHWQHHLRQIGRIENELMKY